MDLKLQLKFSPLGKRVLAMLALACVFGAVGYTVSPKSVGTIAANKSMAKALQMRTEADQVARKQAAKQMQDLQTKLAAATQYVEDVREEVTAQKAKVSAAEKFIADLNFRLDKANTANEPMLRKLEATEKKAADAQAAADKATAQAGELSKQVDALTTIRRKLEPLCSRLMDEKARLEQSLSKQDNVVTDMRALMGAFSFNGSVPSRNESGAEMPITRKEMICWMGHPLLTYDSGNGGSKLRWGWGLLGGKRHSAVVHEGMITEIDGQAPTRAMLASIAQKAPIAPGPIAPWRFQKDDAVRYADLVAMFGQPDGVSGAGDKFSAWWSVGAWARPATATVADGIVTGFDGGGVDPARLCELVRQRTEAYKSDDSALAKCLKTSRGCYDQALKAVGGEMARENEVAMRDGVRLKAWRLAPFDSVGAWVGATNAPADSMTVRAWLDCTWADSVGNEVTYRRYVVVTIQDKHGGTDVADLAIFAPR